PSGESPGGGDGWDGRREPARREARAPDGAGQPRPEPGVVQDASRPAHGHGPAQAELPGDRAGLGREGRLARARDRARGAVAVTRSPEDLGRPRRHPRDRVGRVGGAQDGAQAALGRADAEPLAAEPERRALVAEEGTEPPGARPATAPVVAYHDRAGAGQHEHAGAITKRSEQRRLGVGDDAYALR